MASTVLRSTSALRQIRHRIHSCQLWTAHARVRPVCCRAEVEKPDIRKLAEMAHMHVSDDEVKDWEPKLNSITDWFAQLQAVDLDNVSPSLRVSSESDNRLREDAAETHVLASTFLDQVPDKEGRYVKVPKITSGAD